MRSFKIEGIILKRRDFGEADRILSIFTYQRGKISVVAKGVRRITSRRAGNVELLNRVLMYLHQGKGMPVLTEAESLDTYQNIKSDLTLSTYAYHILELVDKLTAENQENRILYQYIVHVLKNLSINPRQIWIRAFEVKILFNLGFVNFGLQHREFQPEMTNLLEKLQSLPWGEIEKMEITKNEALELERILRYHLERTIESSLKSRQFLKEIK